MKKIGFINEEGTKETNCLNIVEPPKEEIMPSVVRVSFLTTDVSLSYYNDRFNLSNGDIVFVDGKYTGYRGVVTDVTYNFKVPKSRYKQVIGKAELNVKGQFYRFNKYMVSLQRDTLPADQFKTWVLAPSDNEDEEYYTSKIGHVVNCWNLLETDFIPSSILDRGVDYYCDDKVEYLSLDVDKGKAFVKGSKGYYEVDFILEEEGLLSGFQCSCMYPNICKHMVATGLALRNVMSNIEDNCMDVFERNQYFSAISLDVFARFPLINCKKITLE